MNTTSGRTCLILALLSLSLAAGMSIGLNARHTGVTVQAQLAMMQLQAGPETDEGSVAPDADEDEKAVTCAQRASHCPSPKQELALVLSDDRQPHESNAFAAPVMSRPSSTIDDKSNKSLGLAPEALSSLKNDALSNVRRPGPDSKSAS